MTLQNESQLPSVKLFIKNDDGLNTLDISDWSKGKKIVFFCVPGAFTKTCSDRHLPEFIKYREKFAKKGIDAVVCIAVNDPHVMHAWGQQSNAAGKVEMMADPQAELASTLGTSKDFGIPLGTRSKRCAFITDNGVIKYCFVEAPGELTGSSAEAVLAALET